MTAAPPPDLATWVERAMSGEVTVREQQTDQRIMDAVVAELLVTPVHKLSTEAVARRAGLTRMTVFRRFGGRNQLIEATGMREVSRLLSAVSEAFGSTSDPVEAISEAFATALHEAQSHPLVAHWQRTNPGALLNMLLTQDGLAFTVASALTAAQISKITPPGTEVAGDPYRTGEVLARLFIALLLVPPTSVDLTDAAQARRFARETIAPLIVP